MNILTCTVLVCVICVQSALAQEAVAETSDAMPPAVDATIEIDSVLSFRQPKAFGTADSQYWGLTGGIAFALEKDEGSTDSNLAFAYHRFLTDDVEIIGEIGAWYFAQKGDDAGGVNPGITLRWHFLNRGSWTLYTDAGIGLLLATGDVPTGGTSFNFMPRAGVGASFRLGDRGTRGYIGARWHHISNARIAGDGANPDRDGVMFYGGVMFPF